MSTKIAIVFDFDDTLAHDSTTAFLAALGVDTEAFWRQQVQPLLEAGWDPIPAYLYRMIEWSNARGEGERITRPMLRDFGTRVALYPGVPELFDTLRAAAREIDPTIDVEFYLISSGIESILRSTVIAGQFHDIWACDFHVNDREEIVYPKNVVSFTEKTRFLFQISKGLIGPEARGRVSDVNRRVRGGNFRVKMRNMIFVGDGQTDVPCFALVKRYEGVPIGVYDPDRPSKWGKAWNFITDRRVANLHSANYRPGADLHNTLLMAVRGLAERISETQRAFQP